MYKDKGLLMPLFVHRLMVKNSQTMASTGLCVYTCMCAHVCAYVPYICNGRGKSGYQEYPKILRT